MFDMNTKANYFNPPAQSASDSANIMKLVVYSITTPTTATTRTTTIVSDKAKNMYNSELTVLVVTLIGGHNNLSLR